MFGFMSTEDDAAKGNYGLWDQIRALQWIQEHIHNFGGDPKNVTVFGHSAGGYTIGLLTLSPVCKGLFKRAVCMSGFGTSERAMTHGAKNATIRLAIRLACVNSSVYYSDINTTKMVECIKSKSMADIIQATRTVKAQLTNKQSFFMTPAPVVDHEILLDYPKALLSNASSESFKHFISLDYMAGTNDADGGLLRSKITTDKRLENYTKDGITPGAFCSIVVPRLIADYFEANVNVSKAICNKYKDESSFINQGFRSVEMYGDMMYASEGERTLKMHSKFSTRRSYQYLFTHEPTFTILTTIPPWIRGAYHGDQVPFIFRMPVYDYSEDEIVFNQQIMTYLANFAKFGNPNGNGREVVSGQPYWPAFDTRNGNYINLNINVTVHQHLFQDRMTFWLKTVPSIMSPVMEPNDNGVASDGDIVNAGHLVYSTVVVVIILVVQQL